MTLVPLTARSNYMGRHGTESEEMLMLRWAGKQQDGGLSYFERYSLLDELEDRLYIVKLELGLLSSEEISEYRKRRAELCPQKIENKDVKQIQ